MMLRKSPTGWYPHRGEIYLIHLTKNRPVLVISTNALNRYALDVCVVPLTTVGRANFSLRVQIKAGEGGLGRNSWAKCDQVTTLGKALFLYPPLGRLTDKTIKAIEQAVKLALQLA